MNILLLVYVGIGILLVVLAVPLIQRKVKPNPWYGFRVRQTLADPEIWYAANAYAAKGLLGVGILTIIAAIVMYFIPALTFELYVLGCTAVLVGGLAVNLFLSFRYLRSLES